MSAKESICLRCKAVDEKKASCTLSYLFLDNKSACEAFEENK